MFIVYKITNNINNKVYIGITGYSLEHRWQVHLNSVRSETDNFIFHKALKKYGPENFSKEILYNHLTKQEAQQKEIEMIQQFHSFYLEGHGYNMTYGGQCNDHLKGSKAPRALFTDEQVKLIQQKLLTTNLSYKDILQSVGFLNISESALHGVGTINSGKNYINSKYQYPLRKNVLKVVGSNRTGDKNPAAKLTRDQVLGIISDLANTIDTQDRIAHKYNVSLNTINLINRCYEWTGLHNFKKNIRKESQQKESK